MTALQTWLLVICVCIGVLALLLAIIVTIIESWDDEK